MYVDYVENILCDSYFVEFFYDFTFNYYESGKYDCSNFYVIKLFFVMLSLLLFFFVFLYMLVFVCYDNLFVYNMFMYSSMLDLDVFVTCFMIFFLSFNFCFLCEYDWNF